MSKKFLVPIDLNQLELQNVRMQNLASAPASPVVGQFYYNTTTNKAMVWDGTNWVPWEVGASVSPATATPLMDGTGAVGSSLKYARENHVHPSDTSKVDTTTEINGYALSGNVTLEAMDIPFDDNPTSVIINSPDVQSAIEELDSSLATANTKLAGIEAGAQVNQNAFSNVVVGSTTVAADSATDTLTISGGGGVKVSGNASTDTVTIESSFPVWYATCSTAAGTAAKVATTSDSDFALSTGARVYVKFTNAQSASGTVTLKVDSAAAKNVYPAGSTGATQYHWLAGEVVEFIYDGTNFIMVNGGVATTTYYGVTKLSSSTSSTSTALAATASAVKSAYDLANGKSTVSFTQTQSSGTEVGQITINGTTTSLYAPTPAAQVQSNWTEADNTSAAYIQNKPTLGTAAAKGVDSTITSGSTSTNLPTTAAVVSYVSTEIGAVDAMRFKGTIGTGGTISSLPNTHQIGDTYRVITAGTYAGQVCEVGDLLIAMTASGTTSSDWCVAQTNIDGAITSITGTSPISVSGSGNSRTVSHANSGATAGSYGDSAAQTPAFGGTFKVPYVTVNATGHVTNISSHNVTIPSTAASTSAAGIVQLNNTVTSTSTTQAATANAVKTAYDHANQAYDMAAAVFSTKTNVTLTAGTTSVTATAPTDASVVGTTYSYEYRSYTAFIGADEVIVDMSVTDGIPTFSIASAITSNIDILVDWGL